MLLYISSAKKKMTGGGCCVQYMCLVCSDIIIESSRCISSSSYCMYCKMCCPGHCKGCHETEDIRYGNDGFLFKCTICEHLFHNNSWCGNGCSSCEKCNVISCLQCKGREKTCRRCTHSNGIDNL